LYFKVSRILEKDFFGLIDIWVSCRELFSRSSCLLKPNGTIISVGKLKLCQALALEMRTCMTHNINPSIMISLQRHITPITTRSATAHKIRLPQQHKAFTCSFKTYGAKIWNMLTPDLRNPNSTDLSFKRNLKTWIKNNIP